MLLINCDDEIKTKKKCTKMSAINRNEHNRKLLKDSLQ